MKEFETRRYILLPIARLHGGSQMYYNHPFIELCSKAHAAYTCTKASFSWSPMLWNKMDGGMEKWINSTLSSICRNWIAKTIHHVAIDAKRTAISRWASFSSPWLQWAGIVGLPPLLVLSLSPPSRFLAHSLFLQAPSISAKYMEHRLQCGKSVSSPARRRICSKVHSTRP